MPQQDPDAIARQFGGSPVPAGDPDAIAKQFGGTPQADVSVKLDYGNGQTEESNWFGSAITFGKHLLSSGNPVPVDMLSSIYQHGNIETAKSVLGAQGEQFDKAKNAFHQGDYSEALRYTIGWLIPLIGPAANAAGDELGRGEYAAGLGDMVGLAAQPLVAKGVGSALKTGKIQIASRLNPIAAEAVAFADREKIPLDVATRTGNETARTVQNVTAKQLGGAGVAADARTAQTTALTKTAEDLKTRVEPRLASDYTPETAGAAVQGTLKGRAERFGGKANDAYTELRRIEALPENAVDVGGTDTAKAARAEQAFNQMVDQGVDSRLETMKEDVRSGSTEMTGKTRRSYVNPDNPLDVGPVVGRFKGGWKKSFSDLAHIDAQPGEIANAIERGKGKLYDLVRKTVRDSVLEEESGDIKIALRDVDLPVEARNVQLPVDMRPVKSALRPLYNELQTRWPITQQQASKGLKALENIVNGEDVLSASDADANLSAVKAIAREAKDARSVGIAKKAVQELDLAVRGAVAKGGPEASAALTRGRSLTKAKYGALDLLDTLRDEPVQVFDQLTSRRDTQLNLLRDVAKQAPQDMPKLGRAFLEGLFDSATHEGGFGKAATISNKWEALGAESKALMYKNPGLIEDLDNFFRIARKISENPNPSGTASTLASVASVGLLITNPLTGISYVLGSNVLARALFNPKAAKALAEGFQIPLGAPGAGKTVGAAYLLKLAGEQGQRLQQQELVPAQ